MSALRLLSHCTELPIRNSTCTGKLSRRLSHLLVFVVQSANSNKRYLPSNINRVGDPQHRLNQSTGYQPYAPKSLLRDINDQPSEAQASTGYQPYPTGGYLHQAYAVDVISRTLPASLVRDIQLTPTNRLWCRQGIRHQPQRTLR